MKSKIGKLGRGPLLPSDGERDRFVWLLPSEASSPNRLIEPVTLSSSNGQSLEVLDVAAGHLWLLERGREPSLVPVRLPEDVAGQEITALSTASHTSRHWMAKVSFTIRGDHASRTE